MTSLVVLPVAVPLAAGFAALAARHRPRVARSIAVAAAAALLTLALALLARVHTEGPVAATLGGWPAPAGIVLIADLFAALLVAVTALVGLCVLVYGLPLTGAAEDRAGYPGLVLVLLAGTCGAFLTGDLFNLYVWYEVLLLGSFALLVLGGGRARLAGGLKYVALSLLSSTFLLAANGLLYGLTGTLNMADLAQRVPGAAPPAVLTSIALLLFVAFGIKGAVFPLFFWLPAAYPTTPAPVAALFGGLLTKVGVYALVRVFTLVLPPSPGTTTLLLWVAGLTMLAGGLGTVPQNELRRILSYHVISQIGFLVMGLALYTPLALAGTVYYTLHVIVVKTALFLVAGIAHHTRGSYRLTKLGGLQGDRPLLAGAFLVAALSLAGIPPLTGFWAKLALLTAAADAQAWTLMAVALTTSFLTLYSMVKVWLTAFSRPADAPPTPAQLPTASAAALYAPLLLLVALTATFGLLAEPLLSFAVRAGEELLAPDAYVDAALNAHGGTSP